MVFEQIGHEIHTQIFEDTAPARARDLGRGAAERAIQQALAGQGALQRRRWIDVLKMDFRNYGYDLANEFGHHHPARDAWEAVHSYLRRL
ncbi:hypothetical protein CR162_18095 [Pseudoroseomonas rhizosphaerae]|uniref:Uncharacterized protein n=2 Tax=Teichococcus rhizosphaerae TaxID=1335062 RepID=A0A2C7A6C9_9PROT|nr:hypothetical protein CR162_18095 [Pseudoroseomonas rhizosphaerae]